MLKYKADIRTIIYIIITSGLFIYQWIYGINAWIYIIFLHFAVAVAVITHNHNHINIWKSKPLNILTDWWLTVFYGVPIFTWIPTHNRNHHRYNNKEGDSSITYRHTEGNHLISLLSYPSVSGIHQLKLSVVPYMQHLKENDKKTYYEYWTQVFVLAAWIIGFLILDWQKAILFVIIPQQFSSFSVFIFNYVQHVHADEESRYNHSRNFMGVNLFLFNNGYHTIHHERASLHWSEVPQEHKKIAHEIHPSLIEKSFWGFMIRTYIISLLVPGLKSKSMRLERLKSKSEMDLAA